MSFLAPLIRVLNTRVERWAALASNLLNNQLKAITLVKLTVLYGHPTDAETFEKYYADIHKPIAFKMPGVIKFELTKFISSPDGSQAAYYRQADIHFASTEQLQETMASPEGQASVADLANFATGGVTVLIGAIED